MRSEIQTGERAEPEVSGGLDIVVVDDNHDAAQGMTDLLELLGHRVVAVAHDGPTALATVIDLKPRLVLMDIGLPGMDGHDVARGIRERPELRDVVLVAVTGFALDADRERSREAGFNVHLVKPVDIDALERVIATVAG